MGNSHNTSATNGLAGFSKLGMLLIVFILSSFQKLMAQADAGPSMDHLKKNATAAAEELEKIRHDEIMSYVYMSAGFAVVIAIAWGTTIMARKRSRREQEERHRIILKNQELKKHHPHHGHSHAHGHVLHKARR